MGKVIVPSGDLKCPQCSKKLSDEGSFIRHLVTHDPTERVQCEVCSKLYKNQASLSSHIVKLHSNRVHSCQFCHREFSSAVCLRRHTETIHTTMERPRLACKFPECAKTFLSKDQAMTHFKREHIDNPVRFPCTFCHKEFKRRADLDQHIATHTTERPHSCATCGGSFTQLSSLKRHLLTHQDKSARVRVKCQLCPQTFLTKWHLQEHVKICHENRKDYPCTYCDKRFSASGGLKRHIEAKHNSSGILHSCDKCGYQSCSKVYLAKHLNRVHNGIRHECYFCAKMFSVFASLVRHVGGIHNLEK